MSLRPRPKAARGDCKDSEAYDWLDAMQNLCRRTKVKKSGRIVNVDAADRIEGFRDEVYGLNGSRKSDEKRSGHNKNVDAAGRNEGSRGKVQGLKGCQFSPYKKVDAKAWKGYSCDAFVLEVLKVEAPVHQDLLYERVRAFLPRTKVDNTVRRTVDKQLRLLEKRNYGYGKTGSYYRRVASGRPKAERTTPRCGGDRSFSQIAPEEIDAGVLKVFGCVASSGRTELPKKVLLSNVYEKFAPGSGGARLVEGDSDWKLLEESLIRLEAQGWLKVRDDADQTVVYLRKKKKKK